MLGLGAIETVLRLNGGLDGVEAGDPRATATSRLGGASGVSVAGEGATELVACGIGVAITPSGGAPNALIATSDADGVDDGTVRPSATIAPTTPRMTVTRTRPAALNSRAPVNRIGRGEGTIASIGLARLNEDARNMLVEQRLRRRDFGRKPREPVCFGRRLAWASQRRFGRERLERFHDLSYPTPTGRTSSPVSPSGPMTRSIPPR